MVSNFGTMQCMKYQGVREWGQSMRIMIKLWGIPDINLGGYAYSAKFQVGALESPPFFVIYVST